MKRLLAGILAGGIATGAQAAVIGEEINYRAGTTELRGYLAWDDAIAGKRPGVLVVHEWWGNNAYARHRADQLAAMGYTALAVDMYGGGRTAEHPNDAKALMQAALASRETSLERFSAARGLLAAQPSVDASRIAAIGYCFGGGVVLDMARRGVDLRAVASFHGMLGTQHPAQPGVVRARILVANGEADSMVSPEQVEAFRREMDTARVDYRFSSYPGAKHGFTNPDADAIAVKYGMDIGYHRAADAASWRELEGFLKESFAAP